MFILYDIRKNQVAEVARSLAIGWMLKFDPRQQCGGNYSLHFHDQTGSGVHTAVFKMRSGLSHGKVSQSIGPATLSPSHVAGYEYVNSCIHILHKPPCLI